jgi:uncharacterized protein YbjT (DUF2867 family)
MNKTILVVGSTGQQGSAVTRKLLSEGYSVKAMTRDPGGPVARELARLGAQPVRADLDDPASLDEAVAGADGVFIVINFWTIGGYGADLSEKRAGEVRQGKAIIDACKRHGVGHVVYSSVGGARRPDHLHAHEVSKAEVEQYLEASGLSYTILQPTWILENDATNPRQQRPDPALDLMLKPGTPLQVLAVADLAAFVNLAFSDPGAYDGLSLELAGDELTGEEMAAILSDTMGTPVPFHSTPVMDFAFGEGHYRADLAGLRSRHPGLLDFRQWVAGQLVQS